MAYLGIGYIGDDSAFSLSDFVERHSAWLKGDRLPRLFGDQFAVLYDSNTAREFAKKCQTAAPKDTIIVYSLSRTNEP